MKYKGLTNFQVLEKQKKLGKNEIEVKKPNIFVRFVKWLISPISLMLLGASLLSLLVEKVFDFYFILALILLNFLVSFWQEKKADKSISSLMEQLKVNCRVLRNRVWKKIESKEIVPGDIVELNLGDIIPADVEILEEKNFTVNESTLTGESFPEEKKAGYACYCGTYVSTGWALAKVTKIGRSTNFGKILVSIDSSYKPSLLEKDILNISQFLSLLSLIAVLILSAFFIYQNKPMIEILTLDLSLIIAGIPVSLPTIMTLIINLGISKLSKENIVVRRLSALEDLANVNLLLTDKTGTLTKNQIEIERVVPYGKYSEEEMMSLAYMAVKERNEDSINVSIINKFSAFKKKINFKLLNFFPFDSERKRSTAFVQKKDRKKILISLGAVKAIIKLCDLNKIQIGKIEKEIGDWAKLGYKSLAIAVKNGNQQDEKNMQFVGIFLLSDSLEENAKETVNFIKEHGIEVKMLTGDTISIAKRAAQELAIKGKIITKQILEKISPRKLLLKKNFQNISGFSDIYPSDKYNLVQEARKRYVVAVTGDGINDLPALKSANVGVAVKNSVAALKSTADIVLLTEGISVIKDAIIESRKIFARVYSYSVYRISESFRVIFTIALLGLFYKNYPLSPIQLIILALLNDIPIISLGYNNVEISDKPSTINPKKRIILSSLYGCVGLINSFLFFIILKELLNFSWGQIQTLFFLKLTVSGHLLIYVAHTTNKWFKNLPSKEVIWATSITQLVATLMAYFGFFMEKTPVIWIVFVWLWAIVWMQVSEWMKNLNKKIK